MDLGATLFWQSDDFARTHHQALAADIFILWRSGPFALLPLIVEEQLVVFVGERDCEAHRQDDIVEMKLHFQNALGEKVLYDLDQHIACTGM